MAVSQGGRGQTSGRRYSGRDDPGPGARFQGASRGRGYAQHCISVMPGLVPPARPKPLRRGEGPGIHVLPLHKARKAWMAGTSPAMTKGWF